jgi:D-3-phosphoglycerate dehydrogenase / 2-oxoglutarate reductase
MTRRVVLTVAAAAARRDDFDGLPGIELVERYDLGDTLDEQKLAAGIDGAWAIVAGGEVYRRPTFEAARALRAIVRWGTGSDAIDLAAATDHGVAVVTAPGANADAVADLALTLMLASLRRLNELQSAVRSGAWRPDWPTGDLTCATVGVVGLGAIGRAVVRRLHGFDCRILAVEPYPDLDFCREFGVEVLGLADALPQLDLITLHAPLAPGTRHLLGAAELAQLPRGAIVVNTARGSLVDQAALTAALSSGALGGAGLDVFEHEPLPVDDPVLSMPNVVTVGHAASFTHLGLQRTGEAVLANLRELVDGTLPRSCLNPQAWADTTP